jgi:hypothetical protein
MSISPDLVAFIRARLDDDEQAANLDATANRRLLREVATKRLMVDECDYVIRSSEYRDIGDGLDLAETILTLLATVYSDHPNFRGDYWP